MLLAVSIVHSFLLLSSFIMRCATARLAMCRLMTGELFPVFTLESGSVWLTCLSSPRGGKNRMAESHDSQIRHFKNVPDELVSSIAGE